MDFCNIYNLIRIKKIKNKKNNLGYNMGISNIKLYFSK